MREHSGSLESSKAPIVQDTGYLGSEVLGGWSSSKLSATVGFSLADTSTFARWDCFCFSVISNHLFKETCRSLYCSDKTKEPFCNTAICLSLLASSTSFLYITRASVLIQFKFRTVTRVVWHFCFFDFRFVLEIAAMSFKPGFLLVERSIPSFISSSMWSPGRSLFPCFSTFQLDCQPLQWILLRRNCQRYLSPCTCQIQKCPTKPHSWCLSIQSINLSSILRLISSSTCFFQGKNIHRVRGDKTLLGHVSISSHKHHALDFVVVFQKSVTEVFKVFLIFPHI